MNFLDTLAASFNQAMSDLIRGLPALIGALLILLVGWIVAGAVGRIAAGLLQRGGVDRLFAQHGAGVFGTAATTQSLSTLAGRVVKWLIFLVFVVAAVNFLGWEQLTGLLNQVLLWIPNLVVAAIILVVAPILGRVLRTTIERGTQTAGVTTGALLGRIAEIAVIAFGIVIAVNQIGIASDLVNILFTGVVAALALAFGLAFGLGGRDVAGQISQDWYVRSREAAARAADAAAADAEARRTAAVTPPATAPSPAPAAVPAAGPATSQGGTPYSTGAPYGQTTPTPNAGFGQIPQPGSGTPYGQGTSYGQGSPYSQQPGQGSAYPGQSYGSGTPGFGGQGYGGGSYGGSTYGSERGSGQPGGGSTGGGTP